VSGAHTLGGRESRLSHVSIYSGLIVFPVTLLLANIIANRFGDSVPDRTFLKYLAMAIVTTHALTICVAIIAIIRIRSRGGALYGQRRACAGLICSIVSLMLFSISIVCGIMGS